MKTQQMSCSRRMAPSSLPSGRYAVALLAVLVIGLAGAVPPLSAAEPALPPGLGGEEESAAEAPALPEGLGDDREDDEPALPQGLGQEGETEQKGTQAEEAPRASLPFQLAGFWQTRWGVRTREDSHQEDLSIGETRLQLELDKQWVNGGFELTADFVYDTVYDHHDVNLHRGTGWLDLRQANVFFTPAPFLDLKMGRQILTWGTGDLIFINDNFPKDWVSFFIGRDTEYLKAPSDAVKASFFLDPANVDIVYTPQFDPDRFISGRRLSYYNSRLGRLAGRDAEVDPARPEAWFDDDELAIRAYRNIEGYELAAYGYYGFWKSPGGSNRRGEATFPSLSVYGASLRGRFAAGIGNIEIGYMDSRDDRDGDDPAVKNSELRVLAGYEQDLSVIADDFTAGVQYYLEHMLDYETYRDNLPPGVPARDEDRHLLTVRLTKLYMRQTLELSLFSYYSPSDDDAYLRPRVTYDITDRWKVEAGGNLFLGRHDHTFFGQFEKNSNVFFSLRYGF